MINNLSMNIGKRFNRLVLIEQLPSKRGRKYYKCRCDCGRIIIAQYSHLKNGDTKSCGCLKKQLASEQFAKHRHSSHKLYGVWTTMKQRCYNANNKSFRNYGGRGIAVCEEWLSNFENFYNWAMKNGYKNNLSLDRKDVNGNYEPGNCRWITQKQQQNNRRNNVVVTNDDFSGTLSQWSSRTGIPYSTLRKRIVELHWDIEKAISMPVKKTK